MNAKKIGETFFLVNKKSQNLALREKISKIGAKLQKLKLQRSFSITRKNKTRKGNKSWELKENKNKRILRATLRIFSFYKKDLWNEGRWRVKSCRIPQTTAGIETSRCLGTWEYPSEYSCGQYLGSYMHIHVQIVKKMFISLFST